MTRTVPVPGCAAAVGVDEGVGLAAGTGPAGVGVAVAAGGRVLVAVGVGVAVFVGVAVLVEVGVGVGVAVLVGVSVGVGTGVAVFVGTNVGVGTGVAVFVGTNVAVGDGTGVALSNRKLALADDDPTRHLAVTVIRTVSPGDPATVKLPPRSPPRVVPKTDARSGGYDETVTIPPLHQPLPESVPLTDGAGPEDGLSASVVGTDWARARATRPGVPWYGGIDTARIAATINTLTHDENRFIAHLRPLGQLWPVQHHRGPRPPPRSSARPAARPHPTTRPPG